MAHLTSILLHFWVEPSAFQVTPKVVPTTAWRLHEWILLRQISYYINYSIGAFDLHLSPHLNWTSSFLSMFKNQSMFGLARQDFICKLPSSPLIQSKCLYCSPMLCTFKACINSKSVAQSGDLVHNTQWWKQKIEWCRAEGIEVLQSWLDITKTLLCNCVRLRGFPWQYIWSQSGQMEVK